MQTILVTGASGFIGKNFLKKFNKNFLIFALLKERVKEKKKKLIKGKNIKYIFFKNKNQIKKLIKDIEINYFVNLATYYTKENEEKDINKLIDSNIQFPTIILNSINKNRLKKILTIGTMAEHSKNHYYRPVNLYAASKKAFEQLLYFYKVKYPKIYFYNLKFYETYHKDDHRPKFVPLLINSYKNNKKIILNSSNLKLNFLHVDDVNNAIKILLTKNIKNGDYQKIK